MEYVNHPLPFEPIETPSTSVVYTAPPQSKPTTNSPLDVTMLAMLGLTMAGAGVMKSESAIAKQKEQDAKKANDLAVLQAQQDAQKADASANWEENLAMQAEAGQDVIVAVKQSQANKNYWAAYAIWKAQVALVEAKKRAQALLLAKKKQTTATNNTKPLNANPKPISTSPTQTKPLLKKGLLDLLTSTIHNIISSLPLFNPEPPPTPAPDPESDALAMAAVGAPATPLFSFIDEFFVALSSNAKTVVTALPVLAMPIAVTFVVTGFIWVMLNPANSSIWTPEMLQEYQDYRLCDSVAPASRPFGCWGGLQTPFPTGRPTSPPIATAIGLPPALPAPPATQAPSVTTAPPPIELEPDPTFELTLTSIFDVTIIPPIDVTPPFDNTPTDEPDRCTREEMESRIAGKTVAQVVGVSDFYPQQKSVDKTWVIVLAIDMCRNGFSSQPNNFITWFKGATRNTINEGHHRFVASRVAGVTPIFNPEPYRDYSKVGIDWPNTHSWEEVQWGF